MSGPSPTCVLPGADLWLREEPDGSFTVGLRRGAPAERTVIGQVRAPPTGTRLVAGSPAASVETEKWVGHLPAPADGVVVAVNHAAEQRPALLEDPAGAGWLYRFVADDPAALRARLRPAPP